MRDPVVIGIMLATLAVTVGIGFFSYRRAKDLDNYFVYGRQLKWVFLGLATFASILSGFGFVGGPGLVYSMGSTSLWMTFAAGLGIPLSFLIVGKKLQRLGGPGVLTLPDAVAKRFQSDAARGAVAIGILLGILAYLGAQLLAAGIVLAAVFEIDFYVAFAIGASIIAIYPLLGGIVAGINTDVLQGSIMVVAALLIFGFALHSGGGMGQITQDIAASAPDMVGPWGLAAAILPLSWLFVFSIGVIGMPHATSKFLMIKDTGQLRRGVLVATAAYMIGSLLWMTVGFAMRARVAAGDVGALAGADDAAPAFLSAYTPSWLAGMAFAGLASAILSTASTFLNVGAGAITRDLPLAFGHRIKHELVWARIWTALLCGAAAGVALAAQELIALLGAVGFGLHAAALVPALAIGLHWKRATAGGVVASVAVAVVGSIYFFVAQQLEFAQDHGWWVPANGLASVAWVMLLSMLVFIVASYLTRPVEDEVDTTEPSPSTTPDAGEPVVHRPGRTRPGRATVQGTE